MNELVAFFSKLTDTSDWPPRWQCGTWSDFHGWLYIISDLTIWLAYMAIPLLLIRFLIIKQGVPLKGVFWLFGAFILLCGLTHLIDALIFWIPVYRISALVRFLTGIVSIGTVLALVRYFDDAVGLKTSQEYEYELQYRQKAVQALERSNEELKQFAYVASHDLQSPLKTIENYLGLLEGRHGGQLDESGLKILHTTIGATHRMRDLIHDLLDYSQVGTDQELLELDLTEVLAETLEEMKGDIEASQAQVRYEKLPSLRVSRSDMKRLFQNLISNGIKYHREGTPPKLTITAQEENAEWIFCVNDNGIGIDPQYFDKIFQVFQRLHSRAQYPGTGVGLATCKKIVLSHNGAIWLTSEPGKGSAFYFSIPKNLKTLHDFKEQTELYTAS
ncbi:hypothetical protein GCM10027275_26040 [Rhabdobacter roseus]|uniref:histidine kinase n=1 Tax=Rhabdobacter roseus TaxID=1655419 RepID=A0A840TLU1_9BACT|nr:ATP-binding protein [Rhabdobacter roseus]MBB5284551.1 hypothetical protein [Rhabdobacter roseus]